MSSWATPYVKKLQAGESVSFRPHGNSMSGRIESGQLVTVVPVATDILQVGDIVLCKVNGRHYLHLIKAIQDGRYQIGNNKDHINGWIGSNGIYGICSKIEK